MQGNQHNVFQNSGLSSIQRNQRPLIIDNYDQSSFQPYMMRNGGSSSVQNLNSLTNSKNYDIHYFTKQKNNFQRNNLNQYNQSIYDQPQKVQQKQIHHFYMKQEQPNYYSQIIPQQIQYQNRIPQNLSLYEGNQSDLLKKQYELENQILRDKFLLQNQPHQFNKKKKPKESEDSLLLLVASSLLQKQNQPTQPQKPIILIQKDNPYIYPQPLYRDRERNKTPIIIKPIINQPPIYINKDKKKRRSYSYSSSSSSSSQSYSSSSSSSSSSSKQKKDVKKNYYDPHQKKDKSKPQTPLETKKILFKLLGINKYSNDKNIILKSSIINGEYVVKHVNNKSTTLSEDLTGQLQDINKKISFKHSRKWDINHEDILEEQDRDQILNHWVFFEISLDNEQNTPIGWCIEPLFRKKKQEYIVNSGRFTKNLYDPNQNNKPPFTRKEKYKKKKEITEFIIMVDNQNVKDLDEFDTSENIQNEVPVIDKKYKDDGKKLSVEIMRINNIDYYDRIFYLAELRTVDKIILDRNRNNCQFVGALQKKKAWELKDKKFQSFKHKNIFEVSDVLLLDMYQKDEERDELFVNIQLNDSKKNIIGVLQLPLFKEDLQNINRGYFYEILDESKNEEIEIEVRIELDQELDKKIWYDPDKGILVSFERLLQFQQEYNITWSVSLLKEGQPIIDTYGAQIVWTSDQNYSPFVAKQFCTVKEGIELCVNWNQVMEELCNNQKSLWQKVGILMMIQAVYTNGEKKEIGWVMTPLFKEDGTLNSGKFKGVKVNKPPIIKELPINLNNIEFEDFLIDYQIDQCRLDDDFLGKVNSEDSDEVVEDEGFFMVSVNYVDDEKNVLKCTAMSYEVQILEGGEIMEDDDDNQIQLKSEEEIKKEGDRFRFYADHEIYVSIDDLKEETELTSDDYHILFILKDQSQKIVAWTYSTILKPDHNLQIGQFNKQLFKPPVDLKQLNKKDIKSISPVINYTIRYPDADSVINDN